MSADLQAEVERLRAEHLELVEELETRIDDLARGEEAECARANRLARELAAANALLERCEARFEGMGSCPDLRHKIGTHLAGQPAAPTRTEPEPGCVCSPAARFPCGLPGCVQRLENKSLARTEHKRGCICVRCEAEQRVLEAGNLVLDSSLRRIADENGGCLADWARAELARREAKR